MSALRVSRCVLSGTRHRCDREEAKGNEVEAWTVPARSNTLIGARETIITCTCRPAGGLRGGTASSASFPAESAHCERSGTSEFEVTPALLRLQWILLGEKLSWWSAATRCRRFLNLPRISSNLAAGPEATLKALVIFPNPARYPVRCPPSQITLKAGRTYTGGRRVENDAKTTVEGHDDRENIVLTSLVAHHGETLRSETKVILSVTHRSILTVLLCNVLNSGEPKIQNIEPKCDRGRVYSELVSAQPRGSWLIRMGESFYSQLFPDR